LIRLLTVTLFLGDKLEATGLRAATKFLMLAYGFLWVRGSYPRIRYDTLISLT
jgi:NADH:ubiquinone oxidoreductase subunit H